MIKRCIWILLFACLAVPASLWTQSPGIEKPDASAVETSTEATDPAPRQAAPAVPVEIVTIGTIGAEFDKLDGICSTWNIGCMSAGDTITRDVGGIRSTLAKHNIGFIGLGLANFGYNFLQAPQNPQVYNNEKPNWSSGIAIWTTYNVPAKKIQIVVGAEWLATNYAGLNGPNAFRFDNAYLHQSLLNGTLSYTIGYAENDTTVYGGYIAGNLATGTLGVNAVIPYALGMTFPPYPAATFNIKYDSKSGLYVIADVARSADPRGIEINNLRDQAGFRLFPHGDGALYMPEIGYKKKSAKDIKEIWFRATGFYNSSHYQDYSSLHDVLAAVKGHNGAASVVLEQQLTQPDKYLPYRGIYWSLTGQYAVPDMNIYHQYYQAALYSIGMWRKRPLDLVILNVNRTQFSRTALNTLEHLPKGAQSGLPTFDDSTNASGTYGYHLRPGMILSGLLAYTKHPTFTPQLKNPFAGQIQVTLYY